jgi:hypothetical protein
VKAATWLRDQSLVQTTALASATLAGSLWLATSSNSVGPWIVRLHVQRGSAPAPFAYEQASMATSAETFAWWTCT